jgi:hypothetical protein
MNDLPPIARREQDFLTMVRDHRGTVTGTVNQTIAAWMLSLNRGNRPRNDRHVERFEKILRDGRWINTGEPIILAREGFLNDGQHRLTAILKTGIPAICDVRFGVDRDSFVATSTGTRRTASQVAAMAGIKRASSVAAVARLLYHYDQRRMGRCEESLDNDVVLDLIEANPLIATALDITSKLRFRPTKTSPFSLIMTVALRQSGPDRVREFAEIAAGRMCDDEQHPAHALYVRLRDGAISGTKFRTAYLAALTARAWNAYAQGERRQVMRVQDADVTNEGFPLISPWKVEKGNGDAP